MKTCKLPDYLTGDPDQCSVVRAQLTDDSITQEDCEKCYWFREENEDA